MAGPRTVGERTVTEDPKDVVRTLNRDIIPWIHQVHTKFAGAMEAPGIGSLLFFDGDTWRSLALGAYAALPNANSTLTLAQGQLWVALPRALTGSWTYTLSTSGASTPDAMSFYNLTSQDVTITAGADTMVLRSLQYGEAAFRAPAWSALRRYYLVANPSF